MFVAMDHAKALRFSGLEAPNDLSDRLQPDPLAWALLHSSPDGMLLVGASGRIVFANQRAEGLFGYERGALLGEIIETLVPDALGDRHRRHRDEYGDEPYTRPMGVGLRVLGKRADGTELPLDVSLSPLIEDSRRLVIATVRLHDDRERERLAHDVLDSVVREAYQIGLSLQVGLQAGTDELQDRTRQALDDLDALIRDVRTRLFNPDPRT
jgi:PAS domain S-box-containing protein